MGKATELDDFLETQRLTPDEIRQRRLAEEISHPDVEVTPDGTFVKRSSTFTASQVVQRPKMALWD